MIHEFASIRESAATDFASTSLLAVCDSNMDSDTVLAGEQLPAFIARHGLFLLHAAERQNNRLAKQ